MYVNIFVVESPLQLLSAIEATNTFQERENKRTKNVLVIRFGEPSRTQNNEQMLSLKRLFEWDEVIDFSDPDTFSLLIHLWRRYKMKHINHKYRGHRIKFFMGEFRSEWMHYLRHYLKPDSTFLLDDGAITIQVQKEYIAKGYFFPNSPYQTKLKKILKKIIYARILNPRILIRPLNLFTVFTLKPIGRQKVITHKYNFVSTLVNTEEISILDEVWFFGSKYSEAKILTEETELKFLKHVQSHFLSTNSNYKFKYIPHRDESCEKLRKIQTDLGISVFPLAMPAELYILNNNVRPSICAGYYTTVLLNMKVLQPTLSVVSFRLPAKDINVKFENPISNVYEFIGESGISITDLE
ncbi:hypothetical protein [Pseudidiomarina sp.]|uniref:hypothetical protein n=1 Tax=Pseudidiomarina sp. TaxID=2081707 RepID=UPI003A970B06